MQDFWIGLARRQVDSDPLADDVLRKLTRPTERFEALEMAIFIEASDGKCMGDQKNSFEQAGKPWK